MHDKIKAILPKEKEVIEKFKAEFECKCIHGCGELSKEKTTDDVADFISQALAEVHAKIPEIVALVEGEVREKIKEEIDDALTAWDCPGIYGGHTQECHTKESAKKFIFEALFSNKK